MLKNGVFSHFFSSERAKPDKLLDSDVIIGYLAGKIPSSGMDDFKKISDLVLLNPWNIPVTETKENNDD